MVFSYYITSPFYRLIWSILQPFRRKNKYILYCEDAFDIFLYQNVGKYLNEVEIVAKNSKVKQSLNALGYDKVSTMPVFPDGVIMFRNMAWKFPHPKIVKIGFKHGAFNFKRHSKARYYNMFSLFFLTSTREIDNVKKLGVSIPLVAAYPKIDSVYDGSISPERLHNLSTKIGIDPKKSTLLFSATWDGSGMSAVDRWYDKLSLLKNKYNLVVTLHDWVSEQYKRVLKTNPDIFFIDDFDRIPYIMLADICISDTSSMIAEFCLLNKPLIIFKAQQTDRTLPDVMAMIQKISIQIDSFSEIENAIDTLLKNPDMFWIERQEMNKILFDTPDGLAGKRAAEKIIELIPELTP